MATLAFKKKMRHKDGHTVFKLVILENISK